MKKLFFIYTQTQQERQRAYSFKLWSDLYSIFFLQFRSDNKYDYERFFH